jgi:hypothetical protein
MLEKVHHGKGISSGFAGRFQAAHSAARPSSGAYHEEVQTNTEIMVRMMD